MKYGAFVMDHDPENLSNNILGYLEAGGRLSRPEAQDAMRILLDSEDETEQFCLIDALQKKRVFPDEVLGYLDELKERQVKIRPDLDIIVDTCGTGGDRSGSINISTGAAIIAAAGGVNIAKHGNHAVTSKSGSSDVIKELGIGYHSPEVCEKMIEEIGFTYLHAPIFNPAFAKVAEVRAMFDEPTIFNLLGPLLNPAGANRQLIACDDKYRELYAAVLMELGVKEAVVVSGERIFDFSNVEDSVYSEISAGFEKYANTFDPYGYGQTVVNLHSVTGGNPRENAREFREILDRNSRDAPRNLLAINAGVVLYLAGVASHIGQGISYANELIDTDEAKKKLNEIVEYSRSVKK